MAYENQEYKEFCKLDLTRGEYLSVRSITSNKGDDAVVKYDFRVLYTKDDGELGFSKKGFRVGEGVFEDMLIGIIDNVEDKNLLYEMKLKIDRRLELNESDGVDADISEEAAE